MNGGSDGGFVMARELERLSAKGVQAKKRPGYYADGGGLYLQVSQAGTKSWMFCFTLSGKSREMGLGSLNTFSLAQARERAKAARQLLSDGIDPIEARDATIKARTLEKAKAKSFEECATAYIKAHRPKWRNSKHAAQWTTTLDTYCGPVFGGLNVADVDTALVLKSLEPIWTTKPETATRLRGRIESVLDWARVRGYRSGDNPARWKGHLQALLPSISRGLRVKHHAALPFDEMGAFMAKLREQEGMAARALELAILTATRTAEMVGAQWSEFDLKAGTWTIPGRRMKAGKEHRVPLSARAVEILDAMIRVHGNPYVFPGAMEGKPLSTAAMSAVLKRMGRSDLTVHGFRSSFRDWAAESTNYPREVCEQALAHSLEDKVEAAYRRGDLFDKRRRLMADWAKFCATIKTPGKVLPIGKRKT